MREEITTKQLELNFDEVWKPVPGFEEYYEVSNMGRVRTKKTRVRGYKAGTELKQTRANDGYVAVTLIRDGKDKRMYVHQVVMLTFIGEPNGLDVNHKNGVRHDNRLANLEYLTHLENCLYSRDVLKTNFVQAGETNGRANLTAEQVREIRRRSAAGARNKDLADEFGVNPTTILMIRDRINWAWLD